MYGLYLLYGFPPLKLRLFYLKVCSSSHSLIFLCVKVSSFMENWFYSLRLYFNFGPFWDCFCNLSRKNARGFTVDSMVLWGVFKMNQVLVVLILQVSFKSNHKRFIFLCRSNRHLLHIIQIEMKYKTRIVCCAFTISNNVLLNIFAIETSRNDYWGQNFKKENKPKREKCC